jgi:microcystin-dependent protein
VSDQYLGEIRLFAFNYAPAGWLTCQGQILAISQNSALFSLLGNYHGGDGRTTFAVPNLQGRVAVGTGQGTGLSAYVLGETLGAPSVSLSAANLPPHNHSFNANTQDGAQLTSSGAQLAKTAYGGLSQHPVPFYNSGAPNIAMAPMAVQPAGASQPHNNLQPYLVMSYCIAMQGDFPPRD